MRYMYVRIRFTDTFVNINTCTRMIVRSPFDMLIKLWNKSWVHPYTADSVYISNIQLQQYLNYLRTLKNFTTPKRRMKYEDMNIRIQAVTHFKRAFPQIPVRFTV